MLGTGPSRWLLPPGDLPLTPLANPLGMTPGAAAFMGTCGSDNVNCDSEVSVPKVLEGEGAVGAGCGKGMVPGWPGSECKLPLQRTRSWRTQSGPVTHCSCVSSPS